MILAFICLAGVSASNYPHSTETEYCNPTDLSPISLKSQEGYIKITNTNEADVDKLVILELDYYSVDMIGSYNLSLDYNLTLDSDLTLNSYLTLNSDLEVIYDQSRDYNLALACYVLDPKNSESLGKLTRVQGNYSEVYTAYQVRFRTPAEHKFDNNPALDLEVQIFHKRDGDESDIAVLSVLYEANDEETSFFLEEARKANGKTESIDLTDALLGWEKVRKFFEYKGTDTKNSKCIEPVTWWVSKDVLVMEKDDLAFFKKMNKENNLESGDNSRSPIPMPTNSSSFDNIIEVFEYSSDFEASASIITSALLSLLVVLMV